jgi:hypothetical protein
MRSAIRWAMLALVVVGVSGCVTKSGMEKSTETYTAKSGQAMVVFMRPSYLGFGISSSVWEVTPAGNKFIGIVKSGTKVAHYTEPGEHVFMVFSEAADFMKATVSPAKTYYAVIQPRPGMWKARFSFRPVRASEFAGAEFKDWDASTEYVVNTEKSNRWAKNTAPAVEKKRVEYWPEWQAKDEIQRESQTLRAQDGR